MTEAICYNYVKRTEGRNEFQTRTYEVRCQRPAVRLGLCEPCAKRKDKRDAIARVKHECRAANAARRAAANA